ncbi:MAG TPA: bifunctional glutamate N-acetyltransferase/amino-acid acetyltransferase ArgJ [Gammaproteobacteria bacterium]|nr:bifunctional glutamate N-acetyltransferase/amino-acid acetyltransferase ArgJ [Gammaproteobacteria bacterium]
MAVGWKGLPTLQPVAGVRIGTAKAGIKKSDRRDLTVFELAPGSTVAAVFTRNRFCAAPVQLAKQHLAAAAPRYLLINTGNANAGTGESGLKAALACCEALAGQAGCATEAVLPFSTGVIGEPLPVDRVTAGLPTALAALADDAWALAAEAIMTTDTVPKGASRGFRVGELEYVLTGISKGAGMIKPNMATMLAFLATDAPVAQAALQQALSEAVRGSFNRITVDGDTSTNDACILVATGAAGGVELNPGSDGFAAFVEALRAVSLELAQAIVRDGEGATKLITVAVSEGASEAECERVAYAVAESPLVKTALFASDPNWGRILAAVGRAGIDDLDVNGVSLYLDDLLIAEHGGRVSNYREEDAAARIAGEEVIIGIRLGRGAAAATVWTCDLSYDYVRINADYRS